MLLQVANLGKIQVVLDRAIETQSLVVGAERQGPLHIAAAIFNSEGVTRFLEVQLLGACNPQAPRDSEKHAERDEMSDAGPETTHGRQTEQTMPAARRMAICFAKMERGRSGGNHRVTTASN
jgi:hypothetical protein